MSKTGVILLSGIILACIWLMVYILITDKKKRGRILIIGAVIDTVLYFICQNSDFLLAGIVVGLIIGLVPWPGSVDGRKYIIARDEAGGTKNLAIITVIFVTMIFMFAALAYPDAKIALAG